ncbi:hypothetical protein SLU01_26570 [Sporosarcina luteola]|uniref:Uncharacterized protein n=1 Tax=Sporosarcina luteola TaxID=582850 RepID=A0A511ZA60_9BACL|nr:hypothetical protein [Sporosarcina luteola]GEN84345.1 hypothetical protein SLU01_26570 [Sporosarcina luteola]
MEILILVVFGIISMLFKGKKTGEAPKTETKRPPAQTEVPDPLRKLKEMSQEMYKEIQREFQTEIEEPPSRQSPPVTQAPVVTVPRETPKVDRPETSRQTRPTKEKKQDRSSARETHRGRLSAHQGKPVWEKPVENHELIPRSDQDLIKGIIFSEILGPPKSKQ